MSHTFYTFSFHFFFANAIYAILHDSDATGADVSGCAPSRPFEPGDWTSRESVTQVGGDQVSRSGEEAEQKWRTEAARLRNFTSLFQKWTDMDRSPLRKLFGNEM